MAAPWVCEPGALLRDVERLLAVMVKDRDRVKELFCGRMSREEPISRGDGTIESGLGNGDSIEAAVRQSDDREESSGCKDKGSVEEVAEGMAEESGENPGFQGSDNGKFDGKLVEGVKGVGKVVKEFKGLVEGKAAAYEPGESYLCKVPWMAAKGFEHHRPCLCPECGVKRNQLMGSGRRSGMTGNTGRPVLRKADGRPFAEPPHFDYELFQKEYVPSDKMIIEMFPNDQERRTKYRDAHTENELLTMFHEWSSKTHQEGAGACPLEQCAVCRFHEGLVAELEIDFHDVGEEYEVIQTSLSDLQTWQKTYLGMDGEFESAQQQLDAGIDIFGGRGGSEALRKYGSYFGRLPKDDLCIWERNHLANNGTIPLWDSGLSKDLFYLFEPPYLGWDQAREKYWDLFVALRKMRMTPGIFVHGMRRGEDKLALLKDTEIETAGSLFRSVITELPPYPKHDLATWEWFHFSKNGQNAAKFMARRDLDETHFQKHFYGGVEARTKWGYLLCLEVDHYGEKVFGPRYFGGVEARAKWGWVLWEHAVNRNPFAKFMEDARGEGVHVFSPGYASDRSRGCDIP